jgi:hypothetical protein
MFERVVILPNSCNSHRYIPCLLDGFYG